MHEHEPFGLVGVSTVDDLFWLLRECSGWDLRSLIYANRRMLPLEGASEIFGG